MERAGTSEITLKAMAEATGGRHHIVTSLKSLLMTIEGLATKGLIPSVGVKWESCASLEMPRTHHEVPGPLIVRSKHGLWPIPESYIVESKVGNHGLPQQLKARHAWPSIIYVTQDSEPKIPHNFPCDRYELEQSAVTSAMQASKGGYWRCYVQNSLNDGKPGDPFGYLRLQPGPPGTAGTVTLTVMAYNYPRLWELLDKLQSSANANGMPSQAWSQDFMEYIRRMPWSLSP